MPAQLPAPLASQHRGGARLARAARPSVRSWLPPPGLARHVRGAVLKDQPPGEGGTHGPAPPRLPMPPVPPPLSGP